MGLELNFSGRWPSRSRIGTLGLRVRIGFGIWVKGLG